MHWRGTGLGARCRGPSWCFIKGWNVGTGSVPVYEPTMMFHYSDNNDANGVGSSGATRLNVRRCTMRSATSSTMKNPIARSLGIITIR